MLCGFSVDFQQSHHQWVEEALQGELVREARWSEAVAVGSLAFAEKVKSELGIKAMHSEVEPAGGTYALREQSEAYGREFASKNAPLSLENTLLE